jgi:hypothetical protein
VLSEVLARYVLYTNVNVKQCAVIGRIVPRHRSRCLPSTSPRPVSTHTIGAISTKHPGRREVEFGGVWRCGMVRHRDHTAWRPRGHTCDIRLHTAKSAHDSNRRGIRDPGLTMALPINRANIGAKPDPAYEIRLLSDGHSPVTHMDLSGIHRMIEHENAPALPEGPHAPGERHQRLPDATLAHSGILEQANYAL